MLNVNPLTADPILRLILALDGHEAGRFSFSAGWGAFSRFIRLQSTCDIDRASFQIDSSDGVSCFVRFARELWPGRSDDVGPDEGRVVLLEFAWLEDPPPLDSALLWSDDDQDVAGFLKTVEAHDAFRSCISDEYPPFDDSTLYSMIVTENAWPLSYASPNRR